MDREALLLGHLLLRGGAAMGHVSELLDGWWPPGRQAPPAGSGTSMALGRQLLS